MNSNKIALARAKVINNQKDIDLNEVFKCYEDNKWRALEGWMASYIGEILLNIDEEHMSEAEDWIKKAIGADGTNGMRWHLARDHAAYAELFKRKGDPAKAKHNLNKAIEIFKECGADGWVTRTQEALTAI